MDSQGKRTQGSQELCKPPVRLVSGSACFQCGAVSVPQPTHYTAALLIHRLSIQITLLVKGCPMNLAKSSPGAEISEFAQLGGISSRLSCQMVPVYLLGMGTVGSVSLLIPHPLLIPTLCQ